MFSTFSWSLTPQAPRSRPSRRALLIVLVAVLLVAGVAYLLDRTHPAPHRAATPQIIRSTGRTVPPDHVDLSGVSWRDFHGIRLPYSRANGPSVTRGDRAWGFTDTAGGAVFAAVHVGVRANAQWGPGVFGPTIRNQVDGTDKPAFLDAITSSYEDLAAKAGVAPGAPVGRAYAVEEGFRVESFTPGAATVDVVTAGPGQDGTTVRAATRIQVMRRAGDWRVLAPPGGDWGASAHAIASLDGYRPFGDEQGDHAQGGS